MFAQLFSSVFVVDNGIIPSFSHPRANFLTKCVISSREVILSIDYLNKKSCCGPDSISPLFM